MLGVMTDASPHPLIGSLVEGYTLDAVRSVWARATDFDASRPVPQDGQVHGGDDDAHEHAGARRELVRVRVWHESPVTVPDGPVPRASARSTPSRPTVASWLIRSFHRRASSAARRKGGGLPAQPPDCTRRGELELASRRDIRSTVIPRPIALSRTESSVEEPFGACEAALFPALGEALSVTLRRHHDAQSGSAVTVLVPLLTGVIELLEAGYLPQPLRLCALALDESGSPVIVDAGFFPPQRESGSATTAQGGQEQAIPAHAALTALASLVEELSALLAAADGPRMTDAPLSSRWACWCDQIEGASARATLTLLEAQLLAWHAEQTQARWPANPANPADPTHDEAAPTEVDAA